MKRSGFKRKKYEEVSSIKKTRKTAKKGQILRSRGSTKTIKTKKKTIKQLKTKLWELCKEIIRSRDGGVCVICEKTGLVGSNWHTGHFIPSSTCGAFLRYDLRNLHSSCYHCNINLGGNGAMFYKRLVSIYGQDFVDKIFIDKNKTIKADELFYQKKIEEYEKIRYWDKSKLFNHTRIYTGEST